MPLLPAATDYDLSIHAADNARTAVELNEIVTHHNFGPLAEKEVARHANTDNADLTEIANKTADPATLILVAKNLVASSATLNAILLNVNVNAATLTAVATNQNADVPVLNAVRTNLHVDGSTLAAVASNRNATAAVLADVFNSPHHVDAVVLTAIASHLNTSLKILKKVVVHNLADSAVLTAVTKHAKVNSAMLRTIVGLNALNDTPVSANRNTDLAELRTIEGRTADPVALNNIARHGKVDPALLTRVAQNVHTNAGTLQYIVGRDATNDTPVSGHANTDIAELRIIEGRTADPVAFTNIARHLHADGALLANIVGRDATNDTHVSANPNTDVVELGTIEGRTVDPVVLDSIARHGNVDPALLTRVAQNVHTNAGTLQYIVGRDATNDAPVSGHANTDIAELRIIEGRTADPVAFTNIARHLHADGALLANIVGRDARNDTHVAANPNTDIAELRIIEGRTADPVAFTNIARHLHADGALLANIVGRDATNDTHVAANPNTDVAELGTIEGRTIDPVVLDSIARHGNVDPALLTRVAQNVHTNAGTLQYIVGRDATNDTPVSGHANTDIAELRIIEGRTADPVAFTNIARHLHADGALLANIVGRDATNDTHVSANPNTDVVELGTIEGRTIDPVVLDSIARHGNVDPALLTRVAQNVHTNAGTLQYIVGLNALNDTPVSGHANTDIAELRIIEGRTADPVAFTNIARHLHADGALLANIVGRDATNDTHVSANPNTDVVELGTIEGRTIDPVALNNIARHGNVDPALLTRVAQNVHTNAGTLQYIVGLNALNDTPVSGHANTDIAELRIIEGRTADPVAFTNIARHLHADGALLANIVGRDATNDTHVAANPNTDIAELRIIEGRTADPVAFTNIARHLHADGALLANIVGRDATNDTHVAANPNTDVAELGTIEGRTIDPVVLDSIARHGNVDPALLTRVAQNVHTNAGTLQYIVGRDATNDAPVSGHANTDIAELRIIEGRTADPVAFTNIARHLHADGALLANIVGRDATNDTHVSANPNTDVVELGTIEGRTIDPVALNNIARHGNVDPALLTRVAQNVHTNAGTLQYIVGLNALNDTPVSGHANTDIAELRIIEGRTADPVAFTNIARHLHADGALLANIVGRDATNDTHVSANPNTDVVELGTIEGRTIDPVALNNIARHGNVDPALLTRVAQNVHTNAGTLQYIVGLNALNDTPVSGHANTDIAELRIIEGRTADPVALNNIARHGNVDPALLTRVAQNVHTNAGTLQYIVGLNVLNDTPVSGHANTDIAELRIIEGRTADPVAFTNIARHLHADGALLANIVGRDATNDTHVSANPNTDVVELGTIEGRTIDPVALNNIARHGNVDPALLTRVAQNVHTNAGTLQYIVGLNALNDTPVSGHANTDIAELRIIEGRTADPVAFTNIARHLHADGALLANIVGRDATNDTHVAANPNTDVAELGTIEGRTVDPVVLDSIARHGNVDPVLLTRVAQNVNTSAGTLQYIVGLNALNDALVVANPHTDIAELQTIANRTADQQILNAILLHPVHGADGGLTAIVQNQLQALQQQAQQQLQAQLLQQQQALLLQQQQQQAQQLLQQQQQAQQQQALLLQQQAQQQQPVVTPTVYAQLPPPQQQAVKTQNFQKRF